MGSVGDSYDNALAESINGLYKAEVIHRRGPWRNIESVEFATSNGSTGSITADCSSPSAISRQRKLRQTSTPHWNNRPWPHNLNQTASGIPGAVHRVEHADLTEPSRFTLVFAYDSSFEWTDLC